MKIRKLRTSFSDAEGTTKAGQVIEVSEPRGRELIKARLAVEVPAAPAKPAAMPKTKSAAKTKNAAKAPAEAAPAPRRRRSV